MEIETRSINEKLARLVRDIELIKNILMAEGELTDWAKNELGRARATSESEYIPIEESKKIILKKINFC